LKYEAYITLIAHTIRIHCGSCSFEISVIYTYEKCMWLRFKTILWH